MKNYSFKPKDFIPISGFYSYCNRNGLPEAESDIRKIILAAYNGFVIMSAGFGAMIGTGLVAKGIEQLLMK